MTPEEIRVITTTDKNRRVCEVLGIEWHEKLEDSALCKCGRFYNKTYCINLDFAADPLRLLAEVQRSKLWEEFSLGIDCLFGEFISIRYLLTPGALLDAFLEWEERRGK